MAMQQMVYPGWLVQCPIADEHDGRQHRFNSCQDVERSAAATNATEA